MRHGTSIPTDLAFQGSLIHRDRLGNKECFLSTSIAVDLRVPQHSSFIVGSHWFSGLGRKSSYVDQYDILFAEIRRSGALLFLVDYDFRSLLATFRNLRSSSQPVR
jgi:hypothetical protein